MRSKTRFSNTVYKAVKYLNQNGEDATCVISMVDAEFGDEKTIIKECAIWIEILDYLMFCFKDEDATEEEKVQIQEMFNTIMGMVPVKYSHIVFGFLVKYTLKKHGVAILVVQT